MEINDTHLDIYITGTNLNWIHNKLQNKFGNKIIIIDANAINTKQIYEKPIIILGKTKKNNEKNEKNYKYVFVIDNKNKEHQIYYEINSILEYKIYGFHHKDYEILEKLGFGMYGTVFLVKNNKTKQRQAMKVEKILEEDILKKDTSKKMWREIEFMETMPIKYPQQFVKLYHYEIKKCEYKNEKLLQYWKINGHISYADKKLFFSKYCSIKWMELIDDTMANIMNKITHKQVAIDFLIQIINIVHILTQNGYNHVDMHCENICVIKTDEKYINILNKKIPTYGFIVKLIDYGRILNKKYEMDEFEQLYIKNTNDITKIFKHFILDMYYINLDKKYPNLKNTTPKQTPEQEAIINSYLNGISKKERYRNKDIEYNFELKKDLYKILYSKEFMEQLNITESIELFDFLPLESIIFIITNYYDIPKILEHLVNLTMYVEFK